MHNAQCIIALDTVYVKPRQQNQNQDNKNILVFLVTTWFSLFDNN